MTRDDLYELRYRSFGWRWVKALLFGSHGGWLRWKPYTESFTEVVCEYGGPTYGVTCWPPLRALVMCLRWRSLWPWREMRGEDTAERTRVPQRFTQEAVARRERSKRWTAEWEAQRHVIEGALRAGGTVKWDGWNSYLMPAGAVLGRGGYRLPVATGLATDEEEGEK